MLIEWKPIKSLGGMYEAGSDGNIRSIKRATTRGGVIKQHINPYNGYCYISTSYKGEIRQQRVHKLIAEAFLGERTEGMQINHIDGDKTNNKPSNLEYCTQSQNMKHAYRLGLEVVKGFEVVDLDLGIVYRTASDASRAIGASQCKQILMVCRGLRSHYRGKHYAFYSDYISGSIPEFTGKYKKKESRSLWQ